MNDKEFIRIVGDKMLTVANTIYLFTALILALFAFLLIIISGIRVYQALVLFPPNVAIQILDSIGLVVISLAIFDVGKYILEEEVSRNKELRSPQEARKTLTKFIVIVFIAMALESIVYTFIASKEDIHLIVYPAALLAASVFLVIGLGIYQKMSIPVEDTILRQKEKHDIADT